MLLACRMAISGVEPSNIKRSSSPALLIANLGESSWTTSPYKGQSGTTKSGKTRLYHHPPKTDFLQSRRLCSNLALRRNYRCTSKSESRSLDRRRTEPGTPSSENQQGLVWARLGCPPTQIPNHISTPHAKKSLFRKATVNNLPSTGRQTTTILRNFPLSTLFRSRRTAGVRLRTLRSPLGSSRRQTNAACNGFFRRRREVN